MDLNHHHNGLTYLPIQQRVAQGSLCPQLCMPCLRERFACLNKLILSGESLAAGRVSLRMHYFLGIAIVAEALQQPLVLHITAQHGITISKCGCGGESVVSLRKVKSPRPYGGLRS